jgi:hypothetical protein
MTCNLSLSLPRASQAHEIPEGPPSPLKQATPRTYGPDRCKRWRLVIETTSQAPPSGWAQLVDIEWDDTYNHQLPTLYAAPTSLLACRRRGSSAVNYLRQALQGLAGPDPASQSSEEPLHSLPTRCQSKQRGLHHPVPSGCDWAKLSRGFQRFFKDSTLTVCIAWRQRRGVKC